MLFTNIRTTSKRILRESIFLKKYYCSTINDISLAKVNRPARRLINLTSKTLCPAAGLHVDSSLRKKLNNGGMNRLTASFFNLPCIELAKQLLGKTLVRVLQDGTVLKGIIVETESYLGELDEASYLLKNKNINQNQGLYMTPGTLHIYLNYGIYHMLSISSKGEGAAVLIRAIQPIEGIDVIQKNRDLFNSKYSKEKSNKASTLRDFELCSGPTSLTIGIGVDMSCNNHNLATSPLMWVNEEPSRKDEVYPIVSCKRIGIESVGTEWATKPLRFYIYGNKSVSKIDKVGELALLEMI
uniref:DNA-3-methyladenine glycosylase n=1 Tax=Clastoptera arizonana TaxID=38151 RepID=A0A1B6BXV2_9HEMI